MWSRDRSFIVGLDVPDTVSISNLNIIFVELLITSCNTCLSSFEKQRIIDLWVFLKTDVTLIARGVKQRKSDFGILEVIQTG